jgi:hypothetical protein
MIISPVVQTEADFVFVNVLNNQTVALSDGDFVVWNTSTPNGVRTTQAAATTKALLVGAASGAIAASGYGLVQTYGYKSAINVLGDTSVTIVAGDILVPVASADYASYSADTTDKEGLYGFIMAGEGVATATTPAAATIKGFLRCM